MNALNTDKEIWRRTPGDYYSPSIHVTADGGIGINCGGHVLVAPVEMWHEWGKAAKPQYPHDGNTHIIRKLRKVAKGEL